MLRGLLQHWKSVQGASRSLNTQAHDMGVKVYIIYYSMCAASRLFLFSRAMVLTREYGTEALNL